MTVLILLLGAYLLGGVPVGVLVARAYHINIFEVGSGNIGVTNVSRALGWKAWPMVFIPDVLKGAIPAWVANAVIHTPVQGLDVQTISFIAGLCAVLGHCASPFLRFKGGKGVATALGAGIGAAPLVALSSFALFGIVLVCFRFMAIASVVGVAAPMMFGALYPHQSLQLEPFYALLSATVTFRHRKNFSRLLQGTEPKFSFRKSNSAKSANLEAGLERLDTGESAGGKDSDSPLPNAPLNPISPTDPSEPSESNHLDVISDPR